MTTEVLVCTFNGARYIAEQLDSIFSQSASIDQISIYDDQSSDGTVERIHAYLAQLPEAQRERVRLEVNGTNLGYAGNFMQAIEKSTGEILFLCDQDDIWESSKVVRFLDAFRNSGADMVFSDGALIDAEGRRYSNATVLSSYGLGRRHVLRFQSHAFVLLSKRNYINGCAAAVRRSAALQALPLPCDMPHDYWLALWCSVNGGVYALAEPLYRYRQHAHNVVGIGSSHPLYAWLGIWRHPMKPRERELLIWTAVSQRITCSATERYAEHALRKKLWLGKVVPVTRGRLAKGAAILKSLLDGSYLTYADRTAVLRDIVSLIRTT